MRLTRIVLNSFRSYKKWQLNFGEKTLIAAPNGSGKSNLIEAISMLATGQSERAGKIEEMVAWGSEVGSVTGVLVDEQEQYTELAVVVTRGVVAGKTVPKRRYLVDGVGRARASFAGAFGTVVFAPEDMRLIEGSKERRRKYLDVTLAQAHSDYGRALSVYEASLKRRNKLLDMIREGKARRVELSYWDQSLLKNGEIITAYRRDLIGFLNDHVRVGYGNYRVDYLASALSRQRLTDHLDVEIALGYTLVGPHKDDFAVFEEQVDLKTYGSRGEQRLGVLFLKTGSMHYFESTSKQKPLLLLDDIFSELDEKHRAEILLVTKPYQTVITTAEQQLGVDLPDYERVTIGTSGFGE